MYLSLNIIIRGNEAIMGKIFYLLTILKTSSKILINERYLLQLKEPQGFLSKHQYFQENRKLRLQKHLPVNPKYTEKPPIPHTGGRPILFISYSIGFRLNALLINEGVNKYVNIKI